MPFKVGDIVSLRSSNEISMTITHIVDDDLQEDLGLKYNITANVGDYFCKWLNINHELQSNAFPEESLQMYQPK